ncbi:MAG: histidine triad nucleotide-binding protein [Acidobacteria bacterium]|nr:histidine triad nucleotide-binding protein [Acidobacteriota bacterium]
MPDCIFCQIIERKTPSKIVFEDEQVMAIEDINPQAPVHLLIVPKKHIASLDDATPQEQTLLGHLLLVSKNIARERKIHTSGYRLLTNHGRGAGQSVFHIHFHLLGGRPMHWPPG